MRSYELGRVPRIISGPDALNSLIPAVAGLGSSGAVLIVDEGVALVGYADTIAAVLRDVPLIQHVVARGEPTVGSVDAAADVVRSMPGAVVVAVGGGSALDTAKQAAVVSMGAAGIGHYLLCANPFVGRRPVIAIPTTSGTGAEVTRTCIVSDGSGRKSWTWGDEMLPDVVLLDPRATVTMPAHVTAATGLDAFVHALEACTGQRRNTLSAAQAAAALQLVARHLPAAVEDGADLEARQGMQEAALLAGMAIDNCGTGIAHSIGHALGSLYHVPHGVAVSVALDAAMDWNIAGAPDAFATAATALNTSVSGLSGALRNLFAATAFPSVVERISAETFDPSAIAEMMIAVENRPMLENNCRVVDEAARRDLAQRTVQSWSRFRAAA